MNSKLFVILSGILIMLTSFISINAISSSQKKQVAGISSTSKISISNTAVQTTTPTSSPTVNPTTSPTSSPSSTRPFDQNLPLLYPSAKITSSSDNQLFLTSSDSPKAITDWYKQSFSSSKQKLSSLGYSITNFVATSNNDNIENKLSFSSSKLQAVGEKKITVEISRSHGESMTDIKVDFN